MFNLDLTTFVFSLVILIFLEFLNRDVYACIALIEINFFKSNFFKLKNKPKIKVSFPKLFTKTQK